MKTIRLLLLVLLCAFAAQAQTTSVSGTITAAGGQAYVNGTYTFQLVGGNAPFYLGGVQMTLAQTTITGVLDSGGSFTSVAVGKTASISPAGTSWLFTACPLASAPCWSQNIGIVSGTTLDISTTITPPAIKVIPTPNVLPLAYQDSEIQGPVVGTNYYNLTSALARICVSISGGVCTWASEGASAVSSVFTRTGAVTAQLGDYTSATMAGVTGSGAEAIQGFTLSPYCPVANTAQCFFTSANTQQAVDCSWTTVNTTITCGSSHFVAGDVGKRVFGYTTCNAFNAALATNVASGALTTGTKLTIATQSGTTATFSGAAGAANTVTSNTHCLIWGTPDDTGFAALDTAAQAAPFCSKVLIVASNYMLTDPHLYTQPGACANAGTTAPTAEGNVYYAAGYELEGRGQGATILYLTPGFPENTTCNHGQSTNACFVQPVEGRWSNFQINGGQNSQGVSSKDLVEFDGPGTVENFTCLNWGAGNSTTTGFLVYNWEQFMQVDNSGCGYTGVNATGNGTSGLVAIRLRVENNPIGLLIPIGGDNICYDCGFFGAQFGTASSGIVQSTGAAAFRMYHSQIINPGNIASTVGYLASTTVGANLLLSQTSLDVHGGTNSTVIKCTAHCGVWASQSGFSASGSGNTYSDVSGSFFLDNGGNYGLASGAGVSASGAYLGEANSATLTPVAAGNLVLSGGWGSTAAVTVPVGGNAPIGFTITNSGTGQGATPTITYTFPTAFPIAPISCTATDLGGSNPLLNPFTTSSLTKTGAIFTATGTPTVSDTETMQITCVTP